MMKLVTALQLVSKVSRMIRSPICPWALEMFTSDFRAICSVPATQILTRFVLLLLQTVRDLEILRDQVLQVPLAWDRLRSAIIRYCAARKKENSKKKKKATTVRRLFFLA